MLPTPLKQAVEETTLLLDVLSAEEDEPFMEKLRDVPPRLVAAVRDFAKVLSTSEAAARILGDERKVELDASRIARLYGRLSSVTVEEAIECAEGKLQGILPDFRQFDFVMSNSGEVTRGVVTEEFVEKWLSDREYRDAVLFAPGTASFRRLRTLRGGRVLKEQMVLEGIQPQD
jgi:hypothetical protein